MAHPELMKAFFASFCCDKYQPGIETPRASASCLLTAHEGRSARLEARSWAVVREATMRAIVAK